MRLNVEANINNKQSQQLRLSLAMRQAFYVLQMPLLELSEWLTLEIEQNPVLELIEGSSLHDNINSSGEEQYFSTPDPDVEEELLKKRAYEQNLLRYAPSLYEHLLQ